ncbi:transcriptional regulator [Paenibacillus sp. CAA11]|uniref:ArsR/SmtB family transcription factor n=1 Tax=Paenibacillus sp. CAA11 TaxID=1532905 RepID=UPI000D348D99|nr:metalloregulator ArsR/SmtB family transcription factor [Paenibacillus sp. CAA11]AWB42872.1 transcriptional regulator [Paenibacillus sp. CAA11]
MSEAAKTEAEVCEIICTHPDKTAPLKGLVHPEEIHGMSQIFKALSDPTRVQIAFLLDQAEELCVCDIAELLGCSIATASHHLRQLKAAHITKSRKEGKNVYYALEDDHIHTLMSMTLAHQREKSHHE